MNQQENGNVRVSTIHRYLEGHLVTGRIQRGWKKFQRSDGGTQYVFLVWNSEPADISKYGRYTPVELYVNPKSDCETVERMLNDRFRVFQMDCVLRHDTYLKSGKETTRTFLFVDGPEFIWPAAPAQAAV